MEPPLLTNAVDGLFERFGGHRDAQERLLCRAVEHDHGIRIRVARTRLPAPAAERPRVRRRLRRRLVARSTTWCRRASRCPISSTAISASARRRCGRTRRRSATSASDPIRSRANESQYQMQSIDTVAYATLRPVPSLALAGEFGFLRRPDILSPGGHVQAVTARRPSRSFRTTLASPSRSSPTTCTAEVSLTSDTRDRRSRPTSGGLYRAAVDLVRRSEHEHRHVHLPAVRGGRPAASFP